MRARTGFVLLLLVALPLLAQAGRHPLLAWVDRSVDLTGRIEATSAGMAVASMLNAETARWEYILATRDAEHQRIGQLWLANERHLADLDQQAARGRLMQETAGANQRHFQSLANGWQAAYQSLMQEGQRQAQAWSNDWSQASNDLQQGMQRVQQELQGTAELGDLPMDELIAAAGAADSSAAEAALRQAANDASAALATAIAAADERWQAAAIEAADPEADLDEVDKALGRAHRAWVREANDALDTFRDAARRALRDFDLAVEELQDA